jgi:ABC-type Fe3+-siderophore transport system permease subunit
MALASAPVHMVTIHGHLVGSLWLLRVGIVLAFGLVVAGAVLMARHRKSLSRPARIVVVGIASLAAWAAIAVLLDAGQSGHDWGDAAVSVAFIVLYGLVGCAIVFAVDRTVMKIRRRPRLAP